MCRGASTVSVYIAAFLALSFPLACCSEGTRQQQLAFVSGLAPGATKCAKAASLRVPVATRLVLLREGQREGQTVQAGLLVATRRVHDLVPVRDTPSADADKQQTLAVVKELSSDLMIPGVAMILTLPVEDAVGLVAKEDMDGGHCWVSANGIPLKADKFEFHSNFWGTRKTLDIFVRIPSEHLDEGGLGLLYPGDDVTLARLEEADALEFKAKYAETKQREKALQLRLEPQEQALQLEVAVQKPSAAALNFLGGLDSESSEEALKAELDMKYPSLTRAQENGLGP